jgi:Tn3 transposase DDE domain
MSGYHIRYGGYGGIDYYLVADSYIALFSALLDLRRRQAVCLLFRQFKERLIFG